jgi:hypothetical protein
VRWVVEIELEDEEAVISADFGAICIERARLKDAAELGLTLEDGKHVMAFLRRRVMAGQIHRHRKSNP